MNNSYSTIALIADEYVDYPKVLVDNIVAECARYGYGTLCVTGRELNPRSEFHQDYAHCNNVYQLLHESSIIGLISLSGTICNNIDLPGLTQFVQQYQIPRVSFGIEVPGVASVVVDDRDGMRDLMRHLVNDTDARVFAFIRGYANDPYSMQRESIYREVLAEAGLPIDEALMLEGNYDPLDTYSAVSRLLETYSGKIDAIVAANDVMAQSAARALRAKGLEIPEAVIVSGFDDTEEATKHSPALTTVRQPLREMARMSVDLLHQQILENQATGSTDRCSTETLAVSSELVIRGSTVVSRLSKDTDGCLDSSIIFDELSTSVSGLDGPASANMAVLAEAMADTLQTGSPTFSRSLSELIAQTLKIDHLHWWNNLCFQMDRQVKRWSAPCTSQVRESDIGDAVLPAESGSPVLQGHLLSVAAAVTHAKEQLWQLSMDREFEIHRLQQAQASMQLQISTCSALDEIIATLEWWLENTQPKRCFLITYEVPSTTPHDRARLVYGNIGNERVQGEFSSFESKQILPDELFHELSHGLLVLHPAFAGDQHLGYLLLDPQGLPSVDLFHTALSIGNALRNQYLIEELENNAKRLRSANDELVQLASFDVLTGLPNRFQFQSVFRQQCDNANLESFSLGILFIDLDGFKAVNDSLGHGAGDQLLQHVAKRLTAVVADLVDGFSLTARLGGDEFTIILENTPGAAILPSLAQAILDSLALPMMINGESVGISASIGFSSQQGPAIGTDRLLREADVAMYHAKSLGKNRFVEFTQELDRELQQRAA